MKVYYALVHKDKGSAYGITFPDLPGCFGACDAHADISEAAQTALVLFAQDETDLPNPRSIPAPPPKPPALRASNCPST